MKGLLSFDVFICVSSLCCVLFTAWPPWCWCCMFSLLCGTKPIKAKAVKVPSRLWRRSHNLNSAAEPQLDFSSSALVGWIHSFALSFWMLLTFKFSLSPIFSLNLVRALSPSLSLSPLICTPLTVIFFQFPSRVSWIFFLLIRNLGLYGVFNFWTRAG